jgi:hypothetical protein
LKRQAEVIATPIEVHQVVLSLMNTTGACACGRVMRNVIDPKFILINAMPSNSKMIIAAYCKHCASHINAAIKRCRQVLQQPDVPVEPVVRLPPLNI